MRSSKNTKKNWALHFMIYPSHRRGWYTAVCFDVGLIREGDDFFKLRRQINSLALRYVQSIVKNKLSDDLLNQKLPTQYVRKYKQAKADVEAEQIRRKWQERFSAIIWRKEDSDISVTSRH